MKCDDFISNSLVEPNDGRPDVAHVMQALKHLKSGVNEECKVMLQHITE